MLVIVGASVRANVCKWLLELKKIHVSSKCECKCEVNRQEREGERDGERERRGIPYAFVMFQLIEAFGLNTLKQTKKSLRWFQEDLEPFFCRSCCLHISGN